MSSKTRNSVTHTRAIVAESKADFDQSALVALRNRAFSAGSATAWVPGGAASTTIVAATSLKAMASGIFQFSLGLAFAQAATGTWRVEIISQAAAGGTAITGGTKIGPGNGTNSGAFNNSGGAITVPGFAGALTQMDTGVQTIGTAATAAEFTWDGLIQNSVSATVETPFTYGNQVAVTVTLITTTQAAVEVPSGLSLSFYELP